MNNVSRPDIVAGRGDGNKHDGKEPLLREWEGGTIKRDTQAGIGDGNEL